jgi:hypothetical protein
MVIHPKRQLCVLLWMQRKESQMDHGPLSMVADTFQGVFSEALRNACGTDAKLCRRERIITPFRLGLALTATCASPPVETRAELHRGCQALWGTTVPDKAFSNPVAKPHCADFARTMPSRLIGEMPRTVLGCAKGRALAELRPMVLQDGSSFAIQDGVRAVFPGRVNVVKPAAVALHTTMDRRCDAPTTVVLTPDTTHEPAFLPEPASLRASVLLADRGEVDWPSLRRVQEEGGVLLIRATAGRHPQVVEACRDDGTRLRSLRHKPLQTIHTTLPTRQRVDLVVPWKVDGEPLCLRLLVSWHRQTQRGVALLTPVPATRSRLDMICRADTWRWHVAFLCQEWTSYATLHACDTEHPALVEGVMWIAMAAAALTRFVAPMTQRLVEVPRSTRKAARCAVHVCGDMGQALQSGNVAGLSPALEAAVTSLACHAQRAHPVRDRPTGRSQLGLEPLFGSDDVIAFAEAA